MVFFFSNFFSLTDSVKDIALPHMDNISWWCYKDWTRCILNQLKYAIRQPFPSQTIGFKRICIQNWFTTPAPHTYHYKDTHSWQSEPQNYMLASLLSYFSTSVFTSRSSYSRTASHLTCLWVQDHNLLRPTVKCVLLQFILWGFQSIFVNYISECFKRIFVFFFNRESRVNLIIT